MDFSQHPKKDTNAPNTAETPQGHPLFNEAFPDEPSPRKNRGLIAAIIAVALLMVGGVVYQVLINTKEADPGPVPIVEIMPDPTNDKKPITPPGDRAYVDALDERVHGELVEFTNWLAANEVHGLIGEFGWPDNTTPEGVQWATLAEQWFLDIAQTNMPVYAWASGGGWGEYNLAVHNSEDRIINASNSQSDQLNAYSISNDLGINMAGLEFGTQLEGFSNSNPGTIEGQYIYNAKENYDYIAAEQYTTVRLPFKWERLQPILNGPLDPIYLDYIITSIDFAHQNDMSVLLDLHNYGEYDTAAGKHKLGSPELTHASLVDVWTKLIAAVSDSEAEILYGIMNEPRSLPEEGYTSPANNWEVASQLVVDAIRQTGDEREIVIGGYNWSKLSTWTQYHPVAWITDPENNTTYEAHHYWDADTSGTYTTGYQ